MFSGLFLGKRWSPKIGTTLPKPDLLFGLPTLHKQEIKLFHAHHTLKHFEREHMKKLGTTSPIRVNYNLCFPWGVYEAKKVENSTTKAALFVYVQIARASAVCAALLEELSTPENRLPIISFTSIGAKWEVFLCYESITQPQKARYSKPT